MCFQPCRQEIRRFSIIIPFLQHLHQWTWRQRADNSRNEESKRTFCNLSSYFLPPNHQAPCTTHFVSILCITFLSNETRKDETNKKGKKFTKIWKLYASFSSCVYYGIAWFIRMTRAKSRLLDYFRDCEGEHSIKMSASPFHLVCHFTPLVQPNRIFEQKLKFSSGKIKLKISW